MSHLTVQLVEQIQEAVEIGRPVATAVSKLQGATLPGILEYGCLRWTKGPQSIPALPDAISSSALGRALLEVRAELGLRSTGPQKQPFKRVDIQEVEFHVLEGQDELQDQEWQNILMRFTRSATSVGFSNQAANELQAAMHEMAEN